MRFRIFVGIASLALFCSAAFAQTAATSPLPKIEANDNRAPAGQLKNGVLELRLEIREGSWYPEDDSGGHR